jgi:hypothetical protein
MACNVGAALAPTDRRHPGHRESGQGAKYAAKPSPYLKLDGDGASQCDPERLETLHYALVRWRLIARSRSLSEIRRKLGFLEDVDFDDLVAVEASDNGEPWVPACCGGTRRAGSLTICR